MRAPQGGGRAGRQRAPRNAEMGPCTPPMRGRGAPTCCWLPQMQVRGERQAPRPKIRWWLTAKPRRSCPTSQRANKRSCQRGFFGCIFRGLEESWCAAINLIHYLLEIIIVKKKGFFFKVPTWREFFTLILNHI